MKPSKSALIKYWTGFGIFLFAAILWFFNQKPETAIVIPIGLSGLAILWIMGIQDDLYKKEEVEKK